MVGFIAGAILGGVAMWLWGDKVRGVAESDTAREMRARAADALQAMDSKTSDALDTAKDRVHSTLRAGEDAVRPKVR